VRLLILSLLALILLSCDAMTSFEPPTPKSAAAPAPPIIITSPSEGDSFNEGQYIYIYWSSSEDVSEYVYIELFYNDIFLVVLDQNEYNDGSKSLTLPSGSSYDNGYGYSIKIVDSLNPSNYDFSGYFYIL